MVLENGEWPWSFSRSGLQSRWLDHQTISSTSGSSTEAIPEAPKTKHLVLLLLVPYIPVSIRSSPASRHYDLASSALSLPLNCILPFSSPVKGGPSAGSGNWHCPPSLPFPLLNHLVSPMLLDWGWEEKPCGPCLASCPLCFLFLVCIIACHTEFKVWINQLFIWGSYLDRPMFYWKSSSLERWNLTPHDNSQPVCWNAGIHFLCLFLSPFFCTDSHHWSKVSCYLSSHTRFTVLIYLIFWPLYSWESVSPCRLPDTW